MSLHTLSQNLAARGRNGDSMLIHMTPEEVGGLQALAVAHGGSLSINPDTGLPEANFLKNLLPTLIGAGLTFFSGGVINPLTAGMIVGGVETARTGDLGQGLLAGLGAFGGAGVGSAAGIGTQAAAPITNATVAQGSQAVPGLTAATQTAGASQIAPFAADYGLTQGAQMAPQAFTGTGAGVTGLQPPATPSSLASLSGTSPYSVLGDTGSISALNPVTAGAAATPSPATPGFLDRYTTVMGGKTGALAGGYGMAAPFLQEEPVEFEDLTEKSNYAGPYRPTDREVRFQDPSAPRSSREFSYFSPFNPYPGFYAAASGGQVRRYQEGGDVDERSVRMPGKDYLPGRDPEFNYNFLPVEILQAASERSKGPRSSLGGKGAMFSRLFGGGSEEDGPKGMSPGAAKKSGYDKYKDLTGYKYNPQTQRLEKLAAGGLAALAAGGELLEDGSFVIDARTVAEIGNGSSEAGQELLAQLGGRPVKGPGDGVSDSIPATIEGEQAAAVARDEVIFDPESVAAIGEGDMDEGARRLYAMMDQVAKARKTADRGEDSGAGLAALSAAGAV